jgi:hypothetical protein
MLDDPFVLLLAITLARCVTALAVAYAERLRAGARAELLRAAGTLPAGVEVKERDKASAASWEARSAGQHPTNAGDR